MSNALATRSGGGSPAPAATTHEAPAVTAPLRVADIQAIAAQVARSRLYGMDEAQAFTLMMLAHAKGLHPVQAVERYHVIQGKPSMKADAMLAEFMLRGGTVTWHRYDVEECSATFEAPSVREPVQVSWTIEDAKRAELLKNPMWHKYPRQMLRARVISDAVRMTMPGVVSGIYTPEEVSDFQAGPEAPPEPKAHHAVNHSNSTGHGSGAYANPKAVAEYKAWLESFTDDINQKWLDKNTDAHGEMTPGLKSELIRTYGVSGHLLKWAIAEGTINAPEDVRQGQVDKFAAVLWERSRGGLIEEAEAYARREWKKARLVLAAREAIEHDPDDDSDPEDCEPPVDPNEAGSAG